MFSELLFQWCQQCFCTFSQHIMFSFKDVYSVFLFWESLVVLFSHQMSERVVGAGDKMRAANVLINLWLLGGSISSEHRAEMSERPWSLWARLDKSHESFLLLSHSHLHFYTSVSVQRSDTSCSSEPELWAVNHLRSESEADVAVIYKYVVAACNFHLMWVLHKLQLEHFRFWRSHKTCHCITDESFHQWWSADKTHVSV